MGKNKSSIKTYEVPPNEFFQNYSWYNQQDNSGIALVDTPTQEISVTSTREIKEHERNTRSIVLVANQKHPFVSAFKLYHDRIYELSREGFFVSAHWTGVFLKRVGEFLIRWSTR